MAQCPSCGEFYLYILQSSLDAIFDMSLYGAVKNIFEILVLETWINKIPFETIVFVICINRIRTL